MINIELKNEFSNLLSRIKQTDFLKYDERLRIQYIGALRRIIKLLNNQTDVDLSFWINVQVMLKAYIDLYQKEKITEDVGIRTLLSSIMDAFVKSEQGNLNSSAYYEKEVDKLTEIIKKNSKIADSYNRVVGYIADKTKEINELKYELEQTNRQLEEEKAKNKGKKLDELEAELTNLKNKLAATKGELSKAQERKAELEYLKVELVNQKKLVEQYKSELQKAKEKESAIENWEDKIRNAFSALKVPISRLETECNRLEYLYFIYAFISVLVILLLLAIEIVVYYKIHNSATFLRWEQYWPMVLPVPLAVGLLWGFITQMNRAQKQLIILANQLYEIEYIEGLLLGLNTLSIDVKDSMVKINNAISRLIDNHINNMFTKKIDENKLSDIEKQNALPIEQIPELIKLINKSKG